MNLQVCNTGFDVAESLCLLTKFDEKDPDAFFALFEHVEDVRGWPYSHKTLMLQCIFTGKAQRAFSALSFAESGDYAKVKVAVLKDELVLEAYKPRFQNWKKGNKKTHVEFVKDILAHLSHW